MKIHHSTFLSIESSKKSAICEILNFIEYYVLCVPFSTAKSKNTEEKKVEASHERVEIFGESQNIKLIIPAHSPDGRDR